jgi:hypothetical protein
LILFVLFSELFIGISSCHTCFHFSGPRHLNLLALILSFVSFALFVLIDLMKKYQPVFPAFPLLIVACATLAGSSPLVHIAGKLQYRTYYLWQPFEGPSPFSLRFSFCLSVSLFDQALSNIFVGRLPFVLLQSFGWTLYSIGLMLGLGCLTGISAITMDGLLTLVGVLGNIVFFFCFSFRKFYVTHHSGFSQALQPRVC